MARLIGYCRVSTTEQASSGHSLATQATKLAAYCELHDHELIATMTDEGASASTLDRPELKEALRALADGDADGLVILKLDRLTRNVRDWADLLQHTFGPDCQHQLHSVLDSLDTSSASGRLVLNIMMTVSQWEREVISERTREVLAHRKAQGKRTGGIPYGYRLGDDGESLLPDQIERDAICTARHLHHHGDSLRRIAGKLEAGGHSQRNGKPFTASTVRSLLRADPDAHYAQQ